MKYEITGEERKVDGVILHRIRATANFGLVSKGDIGGWVEHEGNLSQEGLAWVADNAIVRDGAAVSGDAWVYDNAIVAGNARIYGSANILDNAVVKDCARVHESARVFGRAVVSGNSNVLDSAEIYDNAQVFGSTIIHGYAKILEDAKVFDHANVCGDAYVLGCAKVGGYAMIHGDAFISGDAVVTDKTDVIWFRNNWSSGRTFTYTRSNGKWKVGCFYGTGEELIKKAYADSELSGKCYEAIVRATETIYGEIDKCYKNKRV